MAEDGQHDIPTVVKKEPTMTTRAESSATTEAEKISMEDPPMSPRNFANPFSRAQTSLDVDDYFVSASPN
jgi:hypothetical protein